MQMLYMYNICRCYICTTYADAIHNTHAHTHTHARQTDLVKSHRDRYGR